ncbi:MAG: SDR family oxidoreductase [Candidatus Firestonebacteria bacterium]|nr:SDR family oxidoreductase [Candidatus Firestonebacteria bacterium]
MPKLITPGAKTALITGASSGIGRALSFELAARGYELILAARSAKGLAETSWEIETRYGIHAWCLPLDLERPEAPEKLFDQVRRQKRTVDILVNNAGLGASGKYAHAPWHAQETMLQVNIRALARLTHLFLPAMIARKRGKILNVGSTGSFAPMPNLAVYGATKAFVLSFSEALSTELAGTGVSVTALCPGPTATQFAQRAQMEDTLAFRMTVLTPEAVAQAGVRALFRGRKRVVPGLVNKLTLAFVRLASRNLVLRVSKRLMLP